MDRRRLSVDAGVKMVASHVVSLGNEELVVMDG